MNTVFSAKYVKSLLSQQGARIGSSHLVYYLSTGDLVLRSNDLVNSLFSTKAFVCSHCRCKFTRSIRHCGRPGVQWKHYSSFWNQLQVDKRPQEINTHLLYSIHTAASDGTPCLFLLSLPMYHLGGNALRLKFGSPMWKMIVHDRTLIQTLY